jgi:hypothetical protein
MTTASISAIAALIIGVVGAASPSANAAPAPPAVGARNGNDAAAQISASSTQSRQLPLGVSILAVMAGAINRSSNDIFRAATSDKELSEGDWLRVSQAAVDVISAATLITTPGTGPHDAAWAADPRWLGISTEMQAAGVGASIAARNRDSGALADSAARLAQSCQSCHMAFSPRLLTSPSPPPATPR